MRAGEVDGGVSGCVGDQAGFAESAEVGEDAGGVWEARDPLQGMGGPRALEDGSQDQEAGAVRGHRWWRLKIRMRSAAPLAKVH